MKQKKNNIIRISETRLKKIIQGEVSKILHEYSIKRSELYDSLRSRLYPILDNLVCIAIFHTINPYIVPHWINRAKQLPAELFFIKCKSARNSAINQVFIDLFGEQFEDIDEVFYKKNIKYYGNKDGKEKMIADKSAIEYNQLYTPLINETMQQLKIALLEMDDNIWFSAVDDFVNRIQNEK